MLINNSIVSVRNKSKSLFVLPQNLTVTRVWGSYRGKNVIITTLNNKLYLSKNFGSTFQLLNAAFLLDYRSVWQIKVNESTDPLLDAKHIMITYGNSSTYYSSSFSAGKLYISSDFGKTFVERVVENDTVCNIDMSSNGQYMGYATQVLSTGAGNVRISNNYGVTYFQNITANGSANKLQYVMISETGQYIAYCYAIGTTFYSFSQNYGATFSTAVSPNSGATNPGFNDQCVLSSDADQIVIQARSGDFVFFSDIRNNGLTLTRPISSGFRLNYGLYGFYHAIRMLANPNNLLFTTDLDTTQTPYRIKSIKVSTSSSLASNVTNIKTNLNIHTFSKGFEAVSLCEDVIYYVNNNSTLFKLVRSVDYL